MWISQAEDSKQGNEYYNIGDKILIAQKSIKLHNLMKH